MSSRSLVETLGTCAMRSDTVLAPLVSLRLTAKASPNSTSPRNITIMIGKISVNSTSAAPSSRRASVHKARLRRKIISVLREGFVAEGGRGLQQAVAGRHVAQAHGAHEVEQRPFVERGEQHDLLRPAEAVGKALLQIAVAIERGGRRHLAEAVEALNVQPDFR